MLKIKNGRCSSRSGGLVAESHLLIDRISLPPSRHPLQELTVDHYVPNSTVIYGGEGNKTDINEMDADEKRDLDESGEDASRQRRSVMVLSGSNASGKSVYAKGVALIVYMSVRVCLFPTLSVADRFFDSTFFSQGANRLVSSRHLWST